MTYEEMKTRKEQLEKDLGELNKEINKHEKMIYKDKLNDAIALLEDCGYYYGMYTTVGEIESCYGDSMAVEFGDIVDMLKKFI